MLRARQYFRHWEYKGKQTYKLSDLMKLLFLVEEITIIKELIN